MRAAITGTIGSGKSEAVAYLRNKGYDVFDCDEENRKLLLKDGKAYPLIQAAFPECFIDDELDKQKLSAIVFSDEEKRKQLEGICHPLLLQELNRREDDPLFAEVPLLFEAGWDLYFDHNLLIAADEETIRERLRFRGYDDNEINRRLSAQMPLSEKLRRADKIIYNNGSLQHLYTAIDNWLKDLE